jgi:hypothetical protein
MKSTSSKPSRDVLRTEYALDYAKSSSNRFAAKLKGSIAIALQPDVAQVFQSADAVSGGFRQKK